MMCLLRGEGSGDGLVLARSYQNTPHEDDQGKYPVSPDRFGLLRLGRFGSPEQAPGHLELYIS